MLEFNGDGEVERHGIWRGYTRVRAVCAVSARYCVLLIVDSVDEENLLEIVTEKRMQCVRKRKCEYRQTIASQDGRTYGWSIECGEWGSRWSERFRPCSMAS